jgi:FkbM family methyltransferase
MGILLPRSKSILKIGCGAATKVQRSLIKNGLAHYEPETMATIFALLDRSPSLTPNFFDIGAHIGIYALTISAVHPRVGCVAAFEPTPKTYQIGITIKTENNINFDFFQCALSDVTGEAELYISEKGETSNSLSLGFKPSNEAVYVSTETLDRICKNLDYYPDVMKVDVESYEQPVLLGSMKTIEKCRPDIVIELLTSNNRYKTFLGSSVWLHMQTLGYRAYHISPAIPWRKGFRDNRFPISRDWVLTTKPLRKDFYRAYASWRYDLSLCTPSNAKKL